VFSAPTDAGKAFDAAAISDESSASMLRRVLRRLLELVEKLLKVV
jgi:hypothetical protein